MVNDSNPYSDLRRKLSLHPAFIHDSALILVPYCGCIRPGPHTSEIPVPHPPSNLDDIRSDSEDGDRLPQEEESRSDISVD
ncbi:hypothetical protein AVEN_57398-1 [Araneus ventricosus]|uniref:Uncharacterized protein n=1 Tax=Araneus ventricosus TaxID=182803 RepID=A0A4Y2CWH9_ARAVE|nr:hypothetical protein AVEN_57398-1 [Araneus ventricosus]